MLKENEIRADSIPDLDEWGYDSYWSCQDWMTWYNLQKLYFGKKNADKNFAYYWTQQTVGASPFDCRTFNPTFREFLRKNNLESIAWMDTPFRPLLDIAGTPGDVVEDVTEGANTGAKILKYAIPLTVVSLLVYGGYRILIK